MTTTSPQAAPSSTVPASTRFCCILLPKSTNWSSLYQYFSRPGHPHLSLGQLHGSITDLPPHLAPPNPFFTYCQSILSVWIWSCQVPLPTFRGSSLLLEWSSHSLVCLTSRIACDSWLIYPNQDSMEGVLLLSALGRQASSHSYTIRYDLVFPPPLLITAPHLTCKQTHIPAPF